MRCVVTGKTGQIVTALIEAGQRRGIEIIALGRPELDLADPATITSAIQNARADIVINAAAYTGVDHAESDPAIAMAINATGAGAVAAAASVIGAPILHLSTDYVFSGETTGAYVETDQPDPRSVYGHTKLAGEGLVARSNPRHVIVRTSWVFSAHGQNFLRTMLRLAQTRASIGVVGDQRGSPSYAPDIADALLDVATAVLAPENHANPFGIFHMTGAGETTWAGFANAIFEGVALRGGKVADIKTITTAEYPTAAYRPANSCLNGAKLRDVYGITLPAWQDAVGRCLDQLDGTL
jgi:dTDP-4-dehydrorhamnose reductase